MIVEIALGIWLAHLGFSALSALTAKLPSTSPSNRQVWARMVVIWTVLILIVYAILNR